MKSHLQAVFTSSATLLALCFILTATATAQVATADLTGRVLDQNGAVVPGAAVNARHVGTGIARNTVTNEDGEYTITQLPAGNYEISVERQGFSRALVRTLELNVGTRSTLNFDLQPGQLTEVVEVSATGLLVETTKSDLADVVTPIQVQTLPLLNRTFANLSIIAPEARPAGNFDPTKTRVGNVAFNGGDGRQVDVNVDGGDNKDNVVGSLIQNFAYEGIQEFQVLQHRWTAEAGRSVGGIVNVVTKSGSNQFHGSLFANFRDEALRARDFFENQRAEVDPAFEKPSFSRQEIGGSLGGPIKRDRLFFFGTYERFRERQNNVIIAAAIPQLQAIPGTEVQSLIPTPYDDHLLTVKVDQKINDNQHIFYRFSHQRNSSPDDQIPVPSNADLTFGNTTTNKVDSFVVNHAWTVSPTKLNQWVFHYQDFRNQILGVTDRPRMVFPSVQTGRNPNTPQATLEKKFQLRDDFSVTTGNHNLKVGANYIYTRLDGFFFFGAQGYSFTFFHDPLVIANNTNGLYPQGFNTPGAVQNVQFADGAASHKQTINQVAFYVQDDWRVTPRLTLNLGLRWDANIGNLINQDNNRTIEILRRTNHPLAQAVTADRDKLTRTTPSWTEFQPRVGFAYDPTGAGRTVIRGGYGIFYDQLFQNLTLFSLSQTGRELFQTVINLTNTQVGVGALPSFRFLSDPPPPLPPGFSISELAVGGFGRINDPDASEPYVQKFSAGFETSLTGNMTLSSDYVHTIGVNEPRVQVINPLIRHLCDPLFPNSNPASPQCVRGSLTRLLDRAFVDSGLGANRIGQINMIGTTNRSLFDSWATTLRYRSRRIPAFSASYVLSNSRSWGGQPLASYSGNGVATTPDIQFREEEFGPTRLDERHRIVVSGVFDLPGDFQLAPLFQFASSRPYSLAAGIDLDGDGLSANDRICEGVSPAAIFAARGTGVAALLPLGCRQVQVNSQRKGFIVDPLTGAVTGERSGRFLNMDLRAQKTFRLGERVGLKGFVDFFNLFNTENLSFSDRLGLRPATSAAFFMQPNSLYGPGFGPPVGRPLTVQLGVRMDF